MDRAYQMLHEFATPSGEARKKRQSAGVFDEDRMAAAVDIPACGCREREGRKYGELHLNAAVDQPRALRRNARCIDEGPGTQLDDGFADDGFFKIIIQ